ncbi:hypothetical protein [Chelativorans salis]|uniref:Uncharacterized protein n=1 Tax=Chelativorans salis TaxID=2978478 RepID=A0ABT2LHL5_9HYPH|nr:hypothetical protein [Chelativorans sp. EGI FJ00035]MCT7373439.1 hypothetical protein [Chelativorans sp. EGI FJ00035]
MPFAIGLRFYRIGIRRKADKTPMNIGPGAEPCDLIDFANDFVARKSEPTVETTEQRTWFFEPRATNSIRTVHGHINYGTHGFESKFKDVKTRKEKYQRKATDLEEIPLYFQIWVPSDSDFALMAFQSFQGRSCVSFVRSSMIKDFEDRFPGYAMTFRVVASTASFLDAAPVKTVTFLKPKSMKDKADRYLLGRRVDEVDYEVTVRARKRGSALSTYKELRERFTSSGDGFVEFDGHEFERVKADVTVGKKRRTVGVFGSGYDAGLIDVSEDVKRYPSGHPVFESIEDEVDGLMEDFYDGMKT